MNTTISFTDPGAMLGKTVLKIAQVVLVILAVVSVYLAYLASEGLFTDWAIENFSDFGLFFPSVEPQEWIIYFSFGLAAKFLIWLGLLIWLDRKI